MTIKGDNKKVTAKSAAQKVMIIEYLTDHAESSVAELSELLEVKSSRVEKLIYELIAEDIIVAKGANRNRTCQLKV